MKVSSRWQKFKHLIISEIKIGGLFALFFNLLFFSIYPLMLYVTGSAKSEFILAFGYIFIPSITIVIAGGILIAAIFSLSGRKMMNVQAGLVGFVVSVITVILVNYVLWLLLYQYGRTYDTFVQPSLATRLLSFIFFQYPTLLPSIINILVLTYVEWKINKPLISPISLQTQE